MTDTLPTYTMFDTVEIWVTFPQYTGWVRGTVVAIETRNDENFYTVELYTGPKVQGYASDIQSLRY